MEQEFETLDAVARRVIAAFNVQHEKFEELAYAIPEEHYGAHQEFVRRQWQNLFLCSPFGQRTFYKPLGYSAGDYEMMNMIHRNRPEGGSLYEKLIHFLLVSQLAGPIGAQPGRPPQKPPPAGIRAGGAFGPGAPGFSMSAAARPAKCRIL